MTRFDKLELWRELEATEEAFVRRKLASGGYTQPQGLVVREWLETREAARADARATADARTRKQALMWTQVVGAATVLLVIAAFGEWFQ